MLGGGLNELNDVRVHGNILSAENGDVLFCLSEVKEASVSQAFVKKKPLRTSQGRSLSFLRGGGALCAVSGY